jgi:S1-C subfamily serine protease
VRESCAGLGGDQHTGMLVVDSVLPGGPAEGRLQPGDVLVRQQQACPAFSAHM